MGRATTGRFADGSPDPGHRAGDLGTETEAQDREHARLFCSMSVSRSSLACPEKLDDHAADETCSQYRSPFTDGLRCLLCRCIVQVRPGELGQNGTSRLIVWDADRAHFAADAGEDPTELGIDFGLSWRLTIPVSIPEVRWRVHGITLDTDAE
jgi:hypothetical protein